MSLESLTLRPARPEEANLLTELAVRSKAYWGYSDEFMQACRDELTVSGEQMRGDCYDCAVATKGDAVVGYYALQALTDDAVELDALFVEPDSVGSGVGRALIQHAIQHLRSAGVKRLIIQGDPNAEAFYLAAGARQIGQRESDSIAGRFLPLFEINISRS